MIASNFRRKFSRGFQLFPGSVFLLGLSLYLIRHTSLFPEDALWKELMSDRAQSNSFLQTSESRFEQNYHPNYILDDDASTAWVEGLDGDGVGSVIEWPISYLSTSEKIRLEIRNGYQKGEELLRKNGAPQKILISILNQRGGVTMEKEFMLEKRMGWQTLILEPGLLSSGAVASIRLKILSIHPGTIYHDTCISDIRTYAISRIPYNEKLELQKRESLMSWIKSRKQMALRGSNQSDLSIFASGDFEYDTLSKDLVDAQTLSGFQKERHVLETLRRGEKNFKIVLSGPGTQANFPDILKASGLGMYQWALRSDQFSLFESRDSEIFAREYEEGMSYRVELSTIHKENYPNSQRLRSIAASFHEITYGRGSYHARGELLITYDQDGVIESILQKYTQIDSPYEGNSTVDLYGYSRFKKNKTNKIDRIYVVHESQNYEKKSVDVAYSVYRTK